MTPSTLLALWRDRWAKPAISALFVPYRNSALSKQLEAFAVSPVWHSAPWRWSMRMLSGLAAFGVITLPLTPNAQIVFALVIAAVVVYVRRFAGGVLPLALACISLVLSLRYFFWRVGMSLPTSAGTLDFAWAFALCIAEFILWLGSALVVVQRLWPYHQSPLRMEGQPVTWPAVDIVLWLEHASLADLQGQWKAVQALEWPAQRITIRAVCAHEPKPDILAWAQSQGLALALEHTVASAQHPCVQIGHLQENLNATFVWVLDVRSPAFDPLFLQNALGWFVQDPSLDLLYTPGHLLANIAFSQPPTALLNGIDQSAQHALVRRTALEKILETDAALASVDKPTVLCQRQSACEYAWLMISTRPATDAPAVMHVCHPTSTTALQAHGLLDAMEERLRFYRPLAHALWMLTPVALLWLQALPVQSPLLTLGAFFLPHWLMAHLAVAASESRGRLIFSLFLREQVLPLHLLVRTAQSFVRTQCRHFAQHLRQRSVVRDPALPWSQWSAALMWGSLNAWACGHALLVLHRSPQPWNGSILCVLVLWAVWNALQAISTLAVEKETRLVTQTRTQRQKMQAMVQWPGQRPLPCVASGLPNTTLTMEWSGSAHVLQGPRSKQMVFFSLFHGYHEYAFEGHVTAAKANHLELQVAPACRDDYQALSNAIFSRDSQWPRWLPARDADNLLPSRARAALNVLETAFYNLTVQASLALWMQRLRKWLRPGKHHHV